jgi:hypothetical protein
MVILALIPDNPHRTPATPLVLADTPDPEPAAINDVIQHDEGGGGDAAAARLPLQELVTQNDIVNIKDDPAPLEPEGSSVMEDQPPVIEDQTAVADQFGADDAMVPVIAAQPVRMVRYTPETQVQVPHPHNTRLQQRRNMVDRVLTTTGVPEVRVKLSGSAVETITAFLEKRTREGTVDPSANVSVKQALRTRGDDAEKVIIKVLTQMDVLGVWEAVKSENMKSAERMSVFRSSMFLKRKTHPDGSFDKYKAQLVAGGDMQDKKLYEDLSSTTIATSSVFTIPAIAAHERRHVAVVDFGSAFLNAKMPQGVPVHMKLDKTMSEYLVGINPKYAEFRETNDIITVLLKKALYSCVESASLWYQNLSLTLKGLGYIRNEIDICVYKRLNKEGEQCTMCIHDDDLLITSVNKSMINELTDGLKKRYGEITLKHGPLINYLGISIDFSHAGEAKLTMAGYVTSGVSGTARTPAADNLFDTDESDSVTEEVRVWFHRVVVQLLYLAKKGSLGVPTSSVLPCNTCHTMHCSRCREATSLGTIH